MTCKDTIIFDNLQIFHQKNGIGKRKSVPISKIMPTKTTFTKYYTIFTYNSTPLHEVYRTFAADFLLLMFSEHFLINNILTNSKIFTTMKKIKLFSLFAAILFAGSAMATDVTVIF